MDPPNKNMYHFVWNDDDQPIDDEQKLSPKDRVAKILKETELGDIPDLVFRGKTDSKSGKGKKKKEPMALKTEHELFSIDDDYSEDEYDFNVKLDVNDNTNVKQIRSEPQRQYQQRKPAKIPPNINTNHPKRPMATTSNKNSGQHSDTYIEEHTTNSNVDNITDRPFKENTTALLPMDHKFLEMDLDDDVDSGVAVDNENDPHQDTEPIVTVDQVQLTERWRKRRQKINFAVAVILLIVGGTVLIVGIVLIVKMIRGG